MVRDCGVLRYGSIPSDANPFCGIHDSKSTHEETNFEYVLLLQLWCLFSCPVFSSSSIPSVTDCTKVCCACCACCACRSDHNIARRCFRVKFSRSSSSKRTKRFPVFGWATIGVGSLGRSERPHHGQLRREAHQLHHEALGKSQGLSVLSARCSFVPGGFNPIIARLRCLFFHPCTLVGPRWIFPAASTFCWLLAPNTEKRAPSHDSAHEHW